MNFKNILNDIAKTDPEVYEKLSSRRHVLKSFAPKVALAALPFAVGSLFNKAYGKVTDSVTDALNAVLEMAYMQYNLYHIANNTGNLIPPNTTSGNNDQPGFKTIEQQELEHINFLTNLVTTVGGVPFTPKGYNPANVNPAFVPSAYDFTAQKDPNYAPIFVNVFNNYPTFLTLAQLLEDTSVHNYEGEIPGVFSNTTVLTNMFQLLTDEARHAAHVRYLRRMPNVNAPDYPAPWIDNNIPPAVAFQQYYNGEDNVVQNGITITSLPGINGNIPKISATAAFDEPYDLATVRKLILPFKTV
jgi:hypothetical protein